MPEGTEVRNPLQDLVPARLVAAIATEEGVLRPPYPTGIAVVVESASKRRAASPGYATLLARRAAASDRVEAGA